MDSCFRFHFSHQVSAEAVTAMSHADIKELLRRANSNANQNFHFWFCMIKLCGAFRY